MDAIVFIGVNKSGSSRDALQVADQMGYYTVLITNRKKQMIERSEYRDVNKMIYSQRDDIDNLIRIISKLKQKLTICAIVSFIDPYCAIASELSDRFELSSFTTDSIKPMLDKGVSRTILKQTDYNPKFVIINELDQFDPRDIEGLLPVVVKLSQSNGSKDVYRCDTIDEVKEVINQWSRYIPEKKIIIEQLIIGPQYLVETVMIHNKLHIIAIVEQKIEWLNGHFIVTGYYLMHDYSEAFYQSIEKVIKDCLAAFNYHHGPSHFEMRLTGEGWRVIEINPRISGSGMNRFILEGLGINLVKETLKMTLNKEVDLIPRHKHYVYSTYKTVTQMGLLKEVKGIRKATQKPGVVYVYVKPRRGQVLKPPVSMGDRYAFVMARGSNKEEAKTNAKEGLDTIEFVLEDC